jgi:hypothetical protein
LPLKIGCGARDLLQDAKTPIDKGKSLKKIREAVLLRDVREVL